LGITTATYADDIAILLAYNNHINASLRLQKCVFYIKKWLKKWRNRVNGAKSVQVTFITRKDGPISNLERLENPSSRRRKIFRIIPQPQTELEKSYILQAKTIWISIK